MADSEPKFQKGDEVHLKSGGGPKFMTYEGPTDADGNAPCFWFEGTEKQEGVFPESELVKGRRPYRGIAAV